MKLRFATLILLSPLLFTPNAIQDVHIWKESSLVRVVVDVSGTVQIRAGEAQSPDRFFLDVTPARLGSELPRREWPVQTRTLQKVRLGQYDASTVRIVLDGVTKSAVDCFMLANPDRIVLDVNTGPGTSNP